mmetsp:Transcript_117068/g.331321  ORF Transcript_117068/g.331321 Transcript_117068/m.331321 type:complete len:144 (-) Transcript_117068:98-529(-)
MPGMRSFVLACGCLLTGALGGEYLDLGAGRCCLGVAGEPTRCGQGSHVAVNDESTTLAHVKKRCDEHVGCSAISMVVDASGDVDNHWYFDTHHNLMVAMPDLGYGQSVKSGANETAYISADGDVTRQCWSKAAAKTPESIMIL